MTTVTTGEETRAATWVAPINIAVIKYWGKRNEALMLPANGSLSVTIDMSQMRAKTTALAGPGLAEDRLWLNGKETCAGEPGWARFQRCVDHLRARAGRRDVHVHVCSENSFPTGAGVASSAAGYACLAVAVADVLGLDPAHENVSAAARLGSGSACRSVFGGFVIWDRGTDNDVSGANDDNNNNNNDDDSCGSIARQLFTEQHWPELRMVFLFVDERRKKVGSTDGMRRSMETSTLMQERLRTVPDKLRRMEGAIRKRDFPAFAEIAMRDSDQMHAVCLDSYPPLVYLRDASHAVMALVAALNKACGRTVAGYTFDAGPNPVLFALAPDLPLLLAALKRFFPIPEAAKSVFEAAENDNSSSGVSGVSGVLTPELEAKIGTELDFDVWQGTSFSRALLARPGCGPQKISSSDTTEALLNIETGLPIKT